MKKIVGLFMAALVAVPMFTACNGRAPQVQLTNTQDSLNYAFGAANGYAIRESLLGKDTTSKDVKAFIKGFNEGYKEQTENFQSYADGLRVASSLNEQMQPGFLVGDSAIIAQPKVVYKSLYSVLDAKKGQEFMFTQDEAYQYVTKAISRSREAQGKVIFTAAEIDSINVAFGLHNGYQVKQYFLAGDTLGNRTPELIKGIKDGESATTPNKKLYYSGLQIGGGMYKELTDNGLANQESFKLNYDVLKAGLLDAVSNENCLMTNEEAYLYFMQYMTEAQSKPGREFLEANATKDDVIVTASGLQYRIIKEGNGPKPTAEDKVKVDYEGSLIDGTVFDSSIERGVPITFGVNQVIPGWTEGLQLMPVGSIYEFYIPSELGYGERGAGDIIPPFATLIFKVELLGIEK